MQNLVQRNNGVWYARVWAGGRSVWRSLATKDEREARRRLKEEIGRIKDEAEVSAAPPPPAKPLFEDAILAWRDLILSKVSKEGYRKRLMVSLRKVAPHFAGEPVGDLDIPDFTDYVRERLADGRSVSTIKADFTVITGILDAAVLKGWRSFNPLPGALRRVLDYERPLIEPPRRRDIAAFARFCGGAFGDWVRFQARVGCRQANGVTLTWRQVNLAEGTIVFPQTKTGRPITVRINPQVRRMLARLPRAPARRDERGRLLPQPVFWHGHGEPFRNIASVFRARMRRWSETTGHRPFRCHDLRHYFAVRALQNGSMTIYELAQHLGHTSVKTTEFFYLRWLAEHPDWKG
jgi:integrase